MLAWAQHSMQALLGINNKITEGLEYRQAVTSCHQPTSFLSYLSDLRGVRCYHLQYCPWIMYDMPPPLRANQCRWSFHLYILSLAIKANSLSRSEIIECNVWFRRYLLDCVKTVEKDSIKIKMASKHIPHRIIHSYGIHINPNG